MANTPSKHPRSEFYGDFQRWLRESGEDNSQQLARLLRNLRKAREQELTPRQREMLRLYFDDELTMVQISGRLGVNRSTVSRTIARAKRRLYRCLRYGF
ncbi:MAG: sigma-70 family RNA polymerase sigma factor [Oscillibacter sp.]|jgi:RNA polymerase sigma factor (sigma-70 family)|nr:sigma-70 family RNA polymerase sigma factor [Oscillibacter sp.]